jgi:hypothetical protein
MKSEAPEHVWPLHVGVEPDALLECSAGRSRLSPSRAEAIPDSIPQTTRELGEDTRLDRRTPALRACTRAKAPATRASAPATARRAYPPFAPSLSSGPASGDHEAPTQADPVGAEAMADVSCEMGMRSLGEAFDGMAQTEKRMRCIAGSVCRDCVGFGNQPSHG